MEEPYMDLPYREIYSEQTDYQEISLGYFDNRIFGMLLDGTMQIVAPGEEVYHKMLIDDAVRILGRRPRRILIVGGGDGCAARNALKYATEEVVQVELDPRMIEVARKHPTLRKLNKGSMDKVTVVAANALDVSRMRLGKFDLIASDLTEPDSNSKELYSMPFIYSLLGMLEDDGVLSAYANDNVMKFAGSTYNVRKIPNWGTAIIFYLKK